jgi:PD-(D/E)XK nuclease superfamily
MKLLTREEIPENAITVSPTQVALMQRCNYKWSLVRREGKTEFTVQTDKMSLGEMFHKLVENYYKRYIGRPVQILTSEELVELMETTQAENGWTNYEAQLLFFNAYTIFITYINWARRNERLIPVAAEVEAFASTGLKSSKATGRRPIYLHGILDLLAERHSVTGIADPLLEIVDHKTHTRRPWTTNSLVFDIQTNFYPLLLSLQGIEVDRVTINTIDMYLPKKDISESLQREERFQRHSIRVTPTSLKQYQEELYGLIDQMWRYENFKFLRQINKNCSGCGFNELCATYLQGGDLEFLEDTKFTGTTMEATEFDASEYLDTNESYPEMPD